MCGEMVSTMSWNNQLHEGLGIRRSFLVGIVAMAGLMIFVVSTALINSERLTDDVNDILGNRLPSTMDSFRTARAVDNLASSAFTLLNITSEADKQRAFSALDEAQDRLAPYLSALETQQSNDSANAILVLAGELTSNLGNLRNLVEQRLELLATRTQSRLALSEAWQTMQGHLTYRIRMLEADSDVITHLSRQPDYSSAELSQIAINSARLVPISGLYTLLGNISNDQFRVSDTTSPSQLDVFAQQTAIDLSEASEAMQKLPTEIQQEMSADYQHFITVTSSPDNLINLRRRELQLLGDGIALIVQNDRIAREIDEAADNLASGEVQQINSAGELTLNSSRDSRLLLLLVTAAGLLGMLLFFYLHVMKNLIQRTSDLSHAMQEIAKGNFDVTLPLVGKDELGRMASAVHQFHHMAREASARNSQLENSKQRTEAALQELTVKARALESANSELTELSVSDGLTGLANRRRFDDALETLWHQALQSGDALAVLMIDVDRFKEYNDHYGHQDGDSCLQLIASTLKTHINRASDILARYGGEEFSIVLPSCKLADACRIAEQIRRSVEALHVSHTESATGVVTVSIGVASGVPGHEESADLILRQADSALYQAKRAGRNIVYCRLNQEFVTAAALQTNRQSAHSPAPAN
jgi:diguanylate cyclase (GGDEF)-like protein